MKNSIAPIKEQVGVWALLVLPAQPALFSAGLPAFSSLHSQEEKGWTLTLYMYGYNVTYAEFLKFPAWQRWAQVSSSFDSDLLTVVCVCVCVYILLSLLEYFLFLTLCSFLRWSPARSGEGSIFQLSKEHPGILYDKAAISRLDRKRRIYLFFEGKVSLVPENH